MPTTADFKRAHIATCIAHVRERHKDLTARCDSGKKWMLALWLGTIAIVVKEHIPFYLALGLIALELFMFYLLDLYFHYFAVKYHKILNDLDQWIMTASDQEIEKRAFAMQELVSEPRHKERVTFLLSSLLSHSAIAFYAFILTVSIAVTYFVSGTKWWQSQQNTSTHIMTSNASISPPTAP